MKKGLLLWIISIAIAFIVTTGVLIGSMITNKSNKYAYRIQRENIELMYDGARADLVQCIDSTIRVYAPSTCMNGLEILRQCEGYDVDLFFVLSQGHVESHFGTKGMALKTNSVFNVYAYDGVKYDKINSKGKYSHPDLSIEPYLKLLKRRYLVNGKTEKDLMHDYIDVDGQRYASSTEYENQLVNAYHRYTSNKKLMNCYKQYTKYKILTGN